MARLVGKCILMALAIGVSCNVYHFVSGALQSDAQFTVTTGYPHPAEALSAGTESPQLQTGSLRAENAQHMHSSASSVKSEDSSRHAQTVRVPYGYTVQNMGTRESQYGGDLSERGRAVPLVASVRKEGSGGGSGLPDGLPSAQGQTKRLRRRDPSLVESEEEKFSSAAPRALYKGETPRLERGKLRQIEEDQIEETRDSVEKGKEAGKSEETYVGAKIQKHKGKVEQAAREEKRDANKEEDEKGQETTQEMMKGESEEEADTGTEEMKEEEEESEEELREKQEEEDSRAETMESQEEKETEEHAKDGESKRVEDSKAEGMPQEREEGTEEEEEEGREENPEEEDVKADGQDFQEESSGEQRGEKGSKKKEDVGAEGMVDEEEEATKEGGTHTQKALDDLKVEGKEEGQKETEQGTEPKQKMESGGGTRPPVTDRKQEKRIQEDHEKADKEGEKAPRTEGNERDERALVEEEKSDGGNETQELVGVHPGLRGTVQEMYPLVGPVRHVHLLHPYCMFSDSRWCRGKATQQEGKPLYDITDMLRQLEALLGSLSRAPSFGFPFLFPHLPRGVQHGFVHRGGA